MSAALLVSHGQPSDPQAGEAEITDLARQVDALAPYPVAGATLAMPDALERALAAMPTAQIVPVFMTDGWFTRSALPKRLGAHPGRVLAPMGTWVELAALAARQVEQTCAEQGWDPAQTSVHILAHGSGRSPYAALDARIFADRLVRAGFDGPLRCGFVEQAPSLEDALQGAGARSICLPFFAARRGHMLEDVPQALQVSHFPGQVLAPIGLHTGIPEVIARKLG